MPVPFTNSDPTQQSVLAEQQGGEGRFRDLVETTSDWVWEVDANATYTYVSPKVRDMLGYEPQEVLGKTPFDFMAPAEAQRVAALFRPIVEAQKPFSCLLNTNLHKDGHAVVLETSGVPIFRQDHVYCGYRGIDRDVTARQQAEEALQASEERFRNVFEKGPLGMQVVGLDHRFISVNAMFCSMLGYSEAELVGRRFEDITHPDDVPADTQTPERMLQESSATSRVEKRYIRKDGTVFWGRRTVAVIRNAAGEPEYFLGMIEDITQRKEWETQVQQATDALEAASRAKDRFLAVLSHELRTPLAPVLSTAQILEADPTLAPEQHEAMSMIRRNVELEARLIDDLLDVTRIANEKVELNLTTVDLHEHLRHVLAMCEGDIAAKQLNLTVATDAAHKIIPADPARLQQILWNLLKNAVKFTPVQGRITVRTHNPAADHVVLSMQDTGPGIEPEVLPRLFKPFEQGGKHVTRQFGGLGLGLAITKGLVDLHGGTLTAQSDGQGKGTTFTLTLRTATEAPSHRPAADRTESLHALARDRRILLVEDHPDTARAMSSVLKRYGFVVSLAYSIAEATKLAESTPVDLLISDIGLPDGSGLDLMRRLAAAKPLNAIALSGYGMEADIRKSREAGFLAHLTKPVNLAALEQTLLEVLAAPQVAS